MMKRLFFMTLFAAVLCVTASACYKSLPPLCYQQIYDLRGVRSDADRLYDRGTQLPVPEFQTELSKLFAAYPASLPQGMEAGAYRLGWYFRQKDLVRYTGEGIADLCNHCAWFVLNCIPENERPDYAAKIAKMLLAFDDEGAVMLLEELRGKVVPSRRIVQAYSFYDKEAPDSYRAIYDVCAGELNGKKNPKHGLYRSFYPSGMLAMEVFYNCDVPVGYAFSYTEEGKLNEVCKFEKGIRKQVYSSKNQ